MRSVDIEDLIDEYNAADGLPPAQRNPPHAPAASNALPVAKAKRRRRPRQQRMVQTDLEEIIAVNKAAEAAGMVADVPCASPLEAFPPSEIDAPSTSEQPEQDTKDNEGEEDIKFLKEAVRIRTEETQQPAYDYRFLLRPIQEMLAPLRQRKDKEKRLAVTVCGHARRKTVNVHLIDRGNGTQRASVTGIYRCGNGEACPVCARHVAALRAKRYRIAHEAVNALGGTMLTFVFTIGHDHNHNHDDALAPLLAALKSASTGARQDRFWNEKIAPLIHAEGAMTDVHVRRSSRGGWHPHLHVTIACLTKDMDALREGATMLIDQYVKRVHKLGYRARRPLQSVSILDARPNAYAAHHHRRADVEGKLADEMDENTSLSAFDIAELAAAGDAKMRALFKEFVEAMRGSKSGVITAAMAKKLGIKAGTDPGPGFDETTRVGSIPSPVWMKLLDLNLTGTFLDHVESFGREGWQRSRWWALQQTGFAPPVDIGIADEMTVAIKAIALVSDPEAQTIGRNLLASRVEGWAAQHGPDLVAATLDYAEAHAPFTAHGDGDAADMAVMLETWADKAARRRREGAFHMTLAVGDRLPREVVPIG